MEDSSKQDEPVHDDDDLPLTESVALGEPNLNIVSLVDDAEDKDNLNGRNAVDANALTCDLCGEDLIDDFHKMCHMAKVHWKEVTELSELRHPCAFCKKLYVSLASLFIHIRQG